MKTAEKQKLLEMLTSKYSVAELTELTDLLLKDRNQPAVSEGEIEKAWKNWMCTFDNFAKDEQVILEGDFHAAIKQLQSLNVQGGEPPKGEEKYIYLFNALRDKLELEVLLEEVIITMSHAEIFIRSREKMHPTGRELYDDLLERIKEKVPQRRKESN